MRITHQIEHGIDPVKLIQSDYSDTLLSHRTLIGVSWALIVIRVRDKPRNQSEQSIWSDFKMSSFFSDGIVIKCYKRVVLLVDIKVL